MTEVTRALLAAVDTESARETRARAAAEIVREARGYRWVGIYDVGDDEVSLIAHTGSQPPAHERFRNEQGLSGEAVRTRATVVSNDVARAVVPVLGAESGVVIGTLDAESERTRAFSENDVAFLEECAAVLRPLYD